jgi:hypothetical protein
VLVPPQQGKPFHVYLCVGDTSIASVIVQVHDGKERVVFYLSRRMLDAETRLSVFYRLPTKGYTQGGKFWVRRRQDQELEGARNTKLRQVRAVRRVIPYVLCGGLYCLWCRMIWRSCFERGPCPPLYIREARVTRILTNTS